MAWAWSAVGIAGVGAGVLALVAAVFVWSARPHRANRLAAILLALDGTGIGWAGGVLYLAADPVTAAAAQRTGLLPMVLVPMATLALAGTLDAPPARLLGSRLASRIYVVVGALAVASTFAFPGLYFAQVVRVPFATYDVVSGPAMQAAFLAILLASLASFVTSAWAWRHARTRSARRRAMFFALAFGTRDAMFALMTGIYLATGDPAVLAHGASMTIGVYVPLLAYGILKAQLFDIDLKIKWTIRRGTIGAAFAAAFFAGSELLEGLIPVDGTLLGLVAAAIVALALRPLRRFADRVADRALPGVHETPDYIRGRKEEVYRAALEGALQDGLVSDRERDILRRLSDTLGLTHAEAGKIEHALRPALA